VTKWHGFQQIGNSVPPFLAEAVARQIVRALGVSPSKSEAKPQSRDDMLLTLGLAEAAAHYGIEVFSATFT
jgi:DNA (cytosine-5)-methyltransferase 1